MRARFVVLALCAALGCFDATLETPAPSASAVDVLAGGDVAGYAQALEPRPFVFPRDHGPHPDYKTEWWYFTGHLADASGRRFGYQLTFFRQAIAPGMPDRASSWATRQVYVAHFAVTDVRRGELRAAERAARGAAGLAGAGESHPFQVWLEDWSVESIGEAAFPVRLRASAPETGMALDLTLAATKPVVLHGEDGLSRKGAGPGNASYYYSLARLAASGRLRLADRDFDVAGTSWLDREWSTSVLAEDQVGWDWFSIQLDGERELMVFQLRLADGGVDPVSHGTLIAADGSTRPLHLDDFELAVTATWTTDGRVTYPAGWLLSVPSDELELRLAPLVADQELELSFRYWEGAIEASGTRGGRPISGLGYAELVGYGD